MFNKFFLNCYVNLRLVIFSHFKLSNISVRFSLLTYSKTLKLIFIINIPPRVKSKLLIVLQFLLLIVFVYTINFTES